MGLPQNLVVLRCGGTPEMFLSVKCYVTETF